MISAGEQETQHTYGNKEFVEWFAAEVANNYIPTNEFSIFRNFLSGGLLLDLGCGLATHSHFFPREAYRYIGIDVSEAMLAKAKTYCSAPLLAMDMYRLAFSDACFDGFLACASISHFEKQNVGLVLREIWRVLKPDGKGMILVPYGNYSEMMESGFSCDECGGRALVTAYLPEELGRILLRNGFDVVGWREQEEYALFFYVKRR